MNLRWRRRDACWLDERRCLSDLGRSKFRGAHGCGMERVPQFEAEIPDPLRQNEPKFLAPGGVRTPTVRLLFLILIREDGLKSPTMQVQCHHIGRSKRLPRQGGVEELVDDLTTRRADLGTAFGRRMRGDDDPCARSCRSQLQIRAVKEGARGSWGIDASSAGKNAGPGGLAPLAD